MTYGGWELPPEAIGHICLLITADDATSSWTAGLLRIHENHLRVRANRDAKRQLTAASRIKIRPLWPGRGKLTQNLFLHLDPETRERIFGATARHGASHGQARTNEALPLGSAQNHPESRACHCRAARRLHETCTGQRRGQNPASVRGDCRARPPGQRSSRRGSLEPPRPPERRIRLRQSRARSRRAGRCRRCYRRPALGHRPPE